MEGGTVFLRRGKLLREGAEDVPSGDAEGVSGVQQQSGPGGGVAGLVRIGEELDSRLVDGDLRLNVGLCLFTFAEGSAQFLELAFVGGNGFDVSIDQPGEGFGFADDFIETLREVGDGLGKA